MDKDRGMFFVILSVSVLVGMFLYSYKKIEAAAATAPSPSLLQNAIMVKVNEVVDEAKRKLDGLVAVKDNFAEFIRGISYQDSKLTFPVGEDEISFDFGFIQHGPILEGFKEVVPTVKLTGMFEGWGGAFSAGLKAAGLRFAPAGAGLSRVVLLCKDTVAGKIDKEEFVMHVQALFSRFSKTEGFETFSGAMKTIFSPLKSLVEKIKFKGKSLSVFFDEKYQKFKSLFDRKFPKKIVDGEIVEDSEYEPNGSKLSAAKARGVLMALLFKCYTFYSELKRKFEESEAGQEAARIRQEALQAAAELTNKSTKSLKKLEAKMEYNKSLPGFADLSGFLSVELAKVLNRLEDSSAKDALLNLFRNIFGMFGIQFDMLLERVADETPPPEPPAPEMPEPEYDDSFDDFDLDFDF